jgi:hypothetical protein
MVAEYGVPTVPLGRFDTVIVKGVGDTVTVTVPVIVLAGVPESVALTVMGNVPVAVGVPVMTQFVPRVSPAGSGPVINTQV